MLRSRISRHATVAATPFDENELCVRALGYRAWGAGPFQLEGWR